MAKKKSNIKTRFTNTKGEKVTVFKDGTKTRTGGKPEELARLVNQADTLGIDTGEARAMLAQDAKEGYKPYKGSSYETAQKGGKRYEPTILSTVGGRDKFNANIMPEITKMNEGVANLGVEDTTTKTDTTDISDKMIQDEYDSSLTPEQKASNDYIATLTKDYDTIQKAYDDLSKASARTARAETRALRQQYDERKRALEESNKAEYNQTQQAFIRGGQAEYSPTMTAGFLSAREREGQARIGELNDLYMSKVDAINVALEEKEYSNAASEVKALKEIEDNIRKEIKEQAKVAKEETQAIQDRQNVVKVATYLKTNPTSTAIDIFSQFGGEVPFDTIKEITDAMPKAEEDFTLSEGQARYDSKGNLVASRGKTYAPKEGTGAYVAGAEVPEDIKLAAESIYNGRSKLNEYPSAKRLAINAYMNSLYTAEGGNELAQVTYDAIKELETHPGFGGAIGAKGISSFFGIKGTPVGGTDAAGFLAKLDQLKASIKLVNIKYLKGTGALSDAEGKTLEDAGTSLNPSLPETDFTKEMQRVKKALEKANNIAKANTGYVDTSNAELLGTDEDGEFEDPNNIY